MSIESKEFVQWRDDEYQASLRPVIDMMNHTIHMQMMQADNIAAERAAIRKEESEPRFRCMCCGEKRNLIPMGHVCKECYDL